MSTSVKLLMFYKGTGLMSDFQRGDPIKVTKQLAREWLAVLRDTYYDDMEIISYLVKQLDTVNDALCEHYGTTSVNVTNSMDEYLGPIMAKVSNEIEWLNTPKDVVAMWSINVATLIELKFLKDDDMNGFMIMPSV